jgi:hypothetical protein
MNNRPLGLEVTLLSRRLLKFQLVPFGVRVEFHPNPITGEESAEGKVNSNGL